MRSRVRLSHVMSNRFRACQAVSSDVMSYLVMSGHDEACQLVSGLVGSCRIASTHFTSRNLCLLASTHIAPCRVVPRYVATFQSKSHKLREAQFVSSVNSCHVVSRHVWICQVITDLTKSRMVASNLET